MNKNLRAMCVLMIAASITVFSVGCSSEAPKQEAAASAVVETQAEIKDIEEPIAELPMMITSAGQSADFDITKTLMEKAELTYEMNATITPDELGDAKTLVIAVGGSSKGLGAAGIDANDEVKRIDAVVKKAKDQGMKIVALHTGGEGRRGDLSDKFIEAVMPQADYMIVVSTGDKDGFISGIAMENGIPMASVDEIADVIGKLQNTFK